MQKLAKDLKTGDRLTQHTTVFCIVTSSMDNEVLIHLKDRDGISSHRRADKGELFNVIN